ncbi:MAG: eight-cysteine-cluster-containing protein, partial [Myxococcota bacterium]
CVSAGECVEDNVNPGQCGSDDDCGPNASCQTICDDGPGYDDGPGCDCGPDEDCLCADESPPFAGECWNVCIEKPQPGCSNDGGCGSGQVCELDWCEDGMTDCGCDDDDDCACLPVEPSCFGHCVEVTQPECSSSSDCGEGMLCQIEVCEDWSCDCDPSDEDDCYCPMVEPACWGVCVEATQPETCSFEDECGPGATCDIEYCETWTCDCDPSEDGENCSCPDVEPYCYGTCKDLTPPPFGCKDDADCGDNQYCDLPVCLMWCPVDDPDCCGTESLGQCQTWEEPPTPEPTPVPEPGQCVVSGCSGEICAASSLDSICIWEPWYECLALSTCGVNANGGCGWTQNDAFDACLQEALAP